MGYLRSVAIIAAAASLSGCFGPRLIKSRDLPQAEGSVKFRKTRDLKTRIDLVVKNLERPEELIPPGYLYVAWVRGDVEAPMLNIGVLTLDKDLKGELRVLTDLNEFDLFVTAESSVEIDKPTGATLLWARRE